MENVIQLTFIKQRNRNYQIFFVYSNKLKRKNMSGGTFDYNQYRIRDIADRVEQEISKSGTPKTERELKDEGWFRDKE